VKPPSKPVRPKRTLVKTKIAEVKVVEIRTTPFKDADLARKRMGQALSHLATSKDKLKERVLDAYRDYVQEIPPTPKFLPDHDTLNDITAIRDTIHKVRQKIEQNPGPYELLLREGLKNSLEIARSTLDYRIARKLANLMSKLYFKLQDGLGFEYEDELLHFRTTKTVHHRPSARNNSLANF
jgi:hypothetical protein